MYAQGIYGKFKVDLKLGRAKSPACLGFHVCILTEQQLSCFLLSISARPSQGWQQTKTWEGVTPTSACSGPQSWGRSLCVLEWCGKQCHFPGGIYPADPREISLGPISTHSLQVWCCLLLLRLEHEPDWLWAQHLPLPVCLWCHWDSSQDGHVRAGEPNRPAAEPGVDAHPGRGLHRSQHHHSQVWEALLLYTGLAKGGGSPFGAVLEKESRGFVHRQFFVEKSSTWRVSTRQGHWCGLTPISGHSRWFCDC